jgi:2-methylcitrate dehydratase PrpD
MSIQYGVAAALASGELAEKNYARIDDAATKRLIDMMSLEIDDGFTKAFPQQQGSSVAIKLADGRGISRSLPDVVPATPDEVRSRMRAAMAEVRGDARADNVLALVASLEKLPNIDALVSECTGKA